MQKRRAPVYARAYLGTADRVARQQQVVVCRQAVEHLDGVSSLDALYGPHEWEMFVHHLRPDEVAIVPRLLVLDERPLAEGARPGSTFARRVAELERACLYVLDAGARIPSTDAKWLDHLEATHNTITRGRNLSPQKARRMAKAKKKAHPGLVAHWKSLEGSPAFERVRKHWMDPAAQNAQTVIETAPGLAGDLVNASVSTWTRIFGGRTVTRRVCEKRGRRKKRVTT